jgi:CRP/FNR family transcriptional regulator, cyclic AMP receptor protein
MDSSSSRRRQSRLSAESATAIAAYGARTTWPASFQIYQKGARADGLSVVLRGHVVLRNRIRTGRGFVPAIITPGETFGIEGITHDGVYVTDAYAADETETLFVSGVQFRAFVRENPGEALNIFSQLMSERAHLLEKLHSMASQNVEQRLISSLQRLAADKSFLASDGRLRLELKHHRLLCEMVGATRESIALALGRLVGTGVAVRRGMAFLIAPSSLTAHIGTSGADTEAALPLAQESLRH